MGTLSIHNEMNDDNASQVTEAYWAFISGGENGF